MVYQNSKNLFRTFSAITLALFSSMPILGNCPELTTAEISKAIKDDKNLAEYNHPSEQTTHMPMGKTLVINKNQHHYRLKTIVASSFGLDGTIILKKSSPVCTYDIKGKEGGIMGEFELALEK